MKTKKLLSSKIIAILVIVTILTIAATVEFNAAVDFSGGITQVTNEVKNQAKTIMGVVFGAVALFALAFTVAKGIAAAFEYKRGDRVHIGPVIGGGIGTIVAGLASSTLFFGWFGL